LAFTYAAPPEWIAALLALAYALAYLVGVTASATALSRRIGPIFDAAMVRFFLRLGVAVAIAAAAMLAGLQALDRIGFAGDTAASAAVAGIAAGAAGAVVYLAAARLVGLGEIRALLGALR